MSKVDSKSSSSSSKKAEITVENGIQSQHIRKKNVNVGPIPATWLPMFDPENKFRLKWDAMIMIFILYNAIFVPMTLCLALTSPVLTWIDNFADGFFIIDVFMSFRTGFNVRDGAETWLVMEPNQVAMRYLRGWFPIDVLSIGIPFGLVENIEGLGSTVTELFKATSALKIFRLLRLPRLLSRLVTVSIDYQHAARIISLITGFFYFCHFFGCIFFYLARLNSDCTKTLGVYEAELLYAAQNNITTPVDPPEACTWTIGAGVNGTSATIGEKYIISLYWAMMTATTVGYGDISITNSTEQMFAVVIMILSNLMGAIIFGNVTTLIQSLNASENRHSDRTEMIEELIETHGISIELADRMRDTIEYQWDLTRCFDMDQALELLPQSLRVDVLMYVHKQLIMKVPFFQDCDDAFIKTVVYRLKSELILAKDVVFHEGDAADEMYFLRRGNVNVLAPRSTRVVATLEEGGYFGEIGILVSNGRRSNTVLAATKCEYYTLSKADLDWVLDRFPEYRELLRNAALKRLEQMAKVLDASLAGEQGLDLIEGRVLVEVQEMRGVPLTHSGLEKFCRVAVLNHVQNTGHPSQEHVALHDARGHLIHKYDFNAILNFHFEVEQRSFDTVNVVLDVIHKHMITGEKSSGRVLIPICTMKHGVYEQKWHPVMYGKGKRQTKVGEIFLKILLHKEGLTKEQRRISIQSNMASLNSKDPIINTTVNSNNGNAKQSERPASKTDANNLARARGGTSNTEALQMQIELETRLIGMERSIAQVTEMMANIVDRLSGGP